VRILEKLGLSASLTAAGLEASAAMEQRDSPLVLMNCQMQR
jgi:hypothetical protein